MLWFADQTLRKMLDFTEKIISPFTDYGFKKLFGEKLHQDILPGLLERTVARRARKHCSPDLPEKRALGNNRKRAN